MTETTKTQNQPKPQQKPAQDYVSHPADEYINLEHLLRTLNEFGGSRLSLAANGKDGNVAWYFVFAIDEDAEVFQELDKKLDELE